MATQTRRSRVMRSIWAVARVTIREALRQKAAIVILVLLAVILPVLGFTVSGDATLYGRAQMFLDWSFRTSRLLLGLMTMFIACGTIAWELKYKHAYYYPGQAHRPLEVPARQMGGHQPAEHGPAGCRRAGRRRASPGSFAADPVLVMTTRLACTGNSTGCPSRASPRSSGRSNNAIAISSTARCWSPATPCP